MTGIRSDDERFLSLLYRGSERIFEGRIEPLIPVKTLSVGLFPKGIGVDDFRDAVEQLPAQGLQAIGRVLGDVRRTLNADSAYLPEPVALELATAILYAEQALAQGARPDTQHDRHGAEMAARLSGALSGRAPDADPPPTTGSGPLIVFSHVNCCLWLCP